MSSGATGRIPRRRTRRNWTATATAAVAVFALVAGAVGAGVGWLQATDRRTDRAVHAFGRSHPATVTAARVVTQFGNPVVVYTVLALLAVLALSLRQWPWAVAIVVARTAQVLTSATVKDAIGRPRPAFAHPFAIVGGSGFPSGHAGGTALLGVVLAWTAWRWRGARVVTVMGVAVAIALPLAVAVSRVALGVHYPSDVLGGAALGVAAGALAVATGGTARSRSPYCPDREDRVQSGHT